MAKDLFAGSQKFSLLSYEPDVIKLNMTPGGHPVWMFRDKPDDFAYGGNKVRFYEYLIPEIIASGAKILVTSGSLYSNHIRVTAAVAARLGLECRLLITAGDPGPDFFKARTNLSMARELGAELVFVGAFAAMLKVQEYVKGLEQQGLAVFNVPNAGHTPGAVRAYANVLCAACESLDKYGVKAGHIYAPCASGTTLSGLLTGARCLESAGIAVPPITGFCVGNTVRGAQRGVSCLLSKAGSQEFMQPYASPLAEAQSPSVPDVRDCGKNDYGKPDEELLGLRQTVLRDEGIELDRTYNINAFYGMLSELEQNPGPSPVLYINTGGYTG